MELNLKNRTFLLNEKGCHWNEQTILNNEKGTPAKWEQLKANSWVYTEAEYDSAHKRWTAKKIYLLPKYIDRKELDRYPFIQKN
jgi:hypothetical protein